MYEKRKTLSARSVLLSVLLGTDPPSLPVKLLVSTTELFGIAEGTTRTALSRMTAAGELDTDDGWYRIASPRLLQRQQRQATSRRGETADWDGTWIQAVVASDQRRPASDRAALRSALAAARLAELREGVWLRPDNLDTDPTQIGGPLVWLRSIPDDPQAIVEQLWHLQPWADGAIGIRDAVRAMTPALETGDRSSLADGFVLSAAVLRHLQADPLLPDDLLPRTWPGGDLRSAYERFDAAYRAVLGDWFDAHR